MALFLLTCMPLAALLVGTLAVSGSFRFDETARAGDLLWQFFAGIVTALPCLAILLLIRPLVEGSFRPGRLYLSLLLGWQVLPLLLALGCYVAIQSAPFLGRKGYGLTSFSDSALFLAGYYAILSAADYVGQRGELTGYALFLVPLLRLATIAVYARALPALVRGSRWGERAVPAAAMATWPLLACFADFWAWQDRGAPAALAAIGLFLVVGAGVATVGLAPGSGRGLLRSR